MIWSSSVAGFPQTAQNGWRCRKIFRLLRNFLRLYILLHSVDSALLVPQDLVFSFKTMFLMGFSMDFTLFWIDFPVFSSFLSNISAIHTFPITDYQTNCSNAYHIFITFLSSDTVHPVMRGILNFLIPLSAPVSCFKAFRFKHIV